MVHNSYLYHLVWMSFKNFLGAGTPCSLKIAHHIGHSELVIRYIPTMSESTWGLETLKRSQPLKKAISYFFVQTRVSSFASSLELACWPPVWRGGSRAEFSEQALVLDDAT